MCFYVFTLLICVEIWFSKLLGNSVGAAGVVVVGHKLWQNHIQCGCYVTFFLLHYVIRRQLPLSLNLHMRFQIKIDVTFFY